MILADANRFTIVTGVLLFGILSLFLTGHEQLKYSKQPTIIADYDPEQILVIAYKDTLNDDSLFLVKAKEGFPLHYFKSITTNVCFDNKCRILNITVYWNITGRYLGFELPKGEFLSKHDHEPFSHKEYETLNDLLADPNLPLDDISFEKLIEIPEMEVDSIDGISGATTADVSKMVVRGAAYTTYTLWNVVHGSTQDYVSSLTEKQLSAGLIDLILKSPEINDRVWALHRISQKVVWTPKLTITILDFISGNDFFLAYSAVNAIETSHLHMDSLQTGLFSIYENADHSIQRMIVDKLMKAPYLSSTLVISSRKLLGNLNGKQLGDLLKLYIKHAINDMETLRAVAEILKNENRFISQQAYNFLKSTNLSDIEIEELKN